MNKGLPPYARTPEPRKELDSPGQSTEHPIDEIGTAPAGKTDCGSVVRQHKGHSHLHLYDG